MFNYVSRLFILDKVNKTTRFIVSLLTDGKTWRVGVWNETRCNIKTFDFKTERGARNRFEKIKNEKGGN